MSLENTLRSGFYFKMVPETKTLCFLLTFLHCMKWMKCKGKLASKWPPRLKLWKSESLWSLKLTSEQHTLRANQPSENLIFDFQKKSRSHLREKSSPERRWRSLGWGSLWRRQHPRQTLESIPTRFPKPGNLHFERKTKTEAFPFYPQNLEI